VTTKESKGWRNKCIRKASQCLTNAERDGLSPHKREAWISEAVSWIRKTRYQPDADLPCGDV
jgi:hypothetical protein